MVGVGRGMMDIAQGAKQIGLQGAERLGIAAAGTADTYTAKVSDERRLFEQGLGDDPWAAGGRIAGSTAATLPIPGGVAGGILRRAGTAAASGAGAGAVEFVDEGQSRSQNALMGAAGGSAGSVATSAAGKALNALSGKVGSALNREVIAEADKYKVPLSAPDLSTSAAAQRIGTTLEELPIVGTGRFRERQGQAAARAAAGLRDDFANRAGSDSTGDAIQASLRRKLAQNKASARARYDSVSRRLDPAGPVPTPRLNSRAAAFLKSESAKKPEYQSDGLVSMLQRYTVAPDESFSGLQRIRSELGDAIADFYTGPDAATGRRGVQLLQQLKKSVDQDMLAFARRTAPDAFRDFQAANTFYRQNVARYRAEGDLRAALDAKDPDEIFDRFIKRGKGDRAMRFFRALDQKGREAVRLGVLDKAYQKALKDGSDGAIFSPARFATEIEKLDEPSKRIFTKLQYQQIQGFAKLMQHVKRAGQYAENPPTGKRLLPIILGGATGAAAMAQPGATVAGLSAAALSSFLLTDKATSRYLASAARFEAGTPAMQRMADGLDRVLSRAAAMGAIETGG